MADRDTWYTCYADYQYPLQSGMILRVGSRCLFGSLLYVELC
jgi:hypothetical protein